MLKAQHENAVLVTPIAAALPDLEADWIGVDAGYRLIESAGRKCLFAIGDFDSVSGADRNQPVEEFRIVLPVRKDETDAEMAMQTAAELGYREILLWGGLGKRLDHTIANLRCMIWRFPQVTIADEKQQAFVLLPGEYIFEKKETADPASSFHGRFSVQPETHISFFACMDSCISLEGFDYPLTEAEIGIKDMYTVSNALKADQGRVTVHQGRILCVKSRWR